LPEVKRPGLEFEQPFPFSAEINNEWRYTSPTPIYLHDVDRELFNFSLYFSIAHGTFEM
jgi:hypothetical protein